MYKLGNEKVITFTKELYFLLGSGMTLYRAIQIIHSQTIDPKLKAILHSFAENLSEGKSFKECVLQYPENFSGFYCNMVAVGESRGELEEAMKRIYLYLESVKELREKIINAITYPCILVVVGFFVLLAIVIFVLPKFAEIFSNASIVLPLPTRLLLGFHNLIITKYYYIIGFIGALLGLFYYSIKNSTARYYLDKMLLEFPVSGEVFLTLYIARFCRTFGTLYSSGVQLLPALELSKSSLTNRVLENEVDKMIISVHDGKGIGNPLANSKVFPKMASQMIVVGEETGALEKILMNLADYYDQETGYKIKRYMGLVEPLALIIISCFVMLISSAVMLPLFRMSSAIRSF